MHDLGQGLEAVAEAVLSGLCERLVVFDAGDLQLVDVRTEAAHNLLQAQFTPNFAILKDKNQSTVYAETKSRMQEQD